MLIFLNSILSNPTVKKVLLWIFSVLLVVGFIIFHVRETNSYIENMKQMQQIHDEELKKINSAYDEERKQHEVNVAKLQSDLDDARSRYKEASEALDKKKKVEVKSLVDKYGDDPAGMAKRISQVTGFKVVMP